MSARTSSADGKRGKCVIIVGFVLVAVGALSAIGMLFYMFASDASTIALMLPSCLGLLAAVALFGIGLMVLGANGIGTNPAGP